MLCALRFQISGPTRYRPYYLNKDSQSQSLGSLLYSVSYQIFAFVSSTSYVSGVQDTGFFFSFTHSVYNLVYWCHTLLMSFSSTRWRPRALLKRHLNLSMNAIEARDQENKEVHGPLLFRCSSGSMWGTLAYLQIQVCPPFGSHLRKSKYKMSIIVFWFNFKLCSPRDITKRVIVLKCGPKSLRQHLNGWSLFFYSFSHFGLIVSFVRTWENCCH